MGENRKHDDVAPLPGIAPWQGGKRNAAGRIVPRLEAIPHRCYAEPFIGMGGVFFRRTRRPQTEAINDASGEIVNLFRVVRRHVSALVDELAYLPNARAEFDRQRRLDPANLTDVERAARFFYLQRHCYGGLLGKRSFPASPQRGKALGRRAVEAQLAGQCDRLERVTIEQQDFAAFIRAYDRAETLFYLDPPYWGLENYYGKGLFARADFGRLAELLADLKGAFVLSLNDVPEVRELFASFRIERIGVTYKTNGTKRVTELLISNRPARL